MFGLDTRRTPARHGTTWLSGCVPLDWSLCRQLARIAIDRSLTTEAGVKKMREIHCLSSCVDRRIMTHETPPTSAPRARYPTPWPTSGRSVWPITSLHLAHFHTDTILVFFCSSCVSVSVSFVIILCSLDSVISLYDCIVLKFV